MSSDPLIGIVGPCAAGKTSLVGALLARGLHARNIAQEHSYVPDMWRRLTNPDILIFLDVSFENSLRRRYLDWNETEYHEQLTRLHHARQHAHLVIDTNPLTEAEVLHTVLNWLHGQPP